MMWVAVLRVLIISLGNLTSVISNGRASRVREGPYDASTLAAACAGPADAPVLLVTALVLQSHVRSLSHPLQRARSGWHCYLRLKALLL